MLEVHLRYVRSFLRDAARKVPPELRTDFESVLHQISTVAPEMPSPLNGGEGGHGAPAEYSLGSAYAVDPAPPPAGDLGRISQQSFLLEVIRLTSGETTAGRNGLSATAKLFNLPLSDGQDLPPAELPSRRRAMVLIDALFDSQQPMLAFLHERYFRDMVDMIYETTSADNGMAAFRPLLHFALALGYLSAQTNHGAEDCDGAHREALQHYQAGQMMLDPLAMSNLTAIQTVLCAIVFLISTCRMVTAHALIGLVSSAALRLGLHTKNLDIPAGDQHMRARVFAAVLHVDSFAAIVLGLPSFVQAQRIDLSVFDHLVSHAYQQRDWQTAASVAQLKLLAICKSNEEDASSLGETDDGLSRQTIIKHAGSRLTDWREHVAPLLQELHGQAGGAK